MAVSSVLRKKSRESLERNAASAFLEYYEYIRSPKRLFWANVIAGFGRAVGFIVGVTIFLTVLLAVLALLADLPVVGSAFQWIREQLSAARDLRG